MPPGHAGTAADAEMECCDVAEPGHTCATLCVSCAGVVPLPARGDATVAVETERVSPYRTARALSAHMPPPFRPPIAPLS